MKKSGIIGFLLYLIIGLYFINYPFGYIEVPEYIREFDPWIIFVGGVLVIIGGINYMRIGKKKH